MSELLIPDWSEYQLVDHQRAAAWLRQRNGGGAAAIFRVCYSDTHVDGQIDFNLDHADLYDALGLYGYLAAGVNPRSQAGVMARVIRAHGGLRRSWFVAADDEESTGGDESARVNAFLAELDTQLQTPNPTGEDWWYSGLNFAIAHNLPAARGHRFIAAYQGTEPTAVAHDLWQFTDVQVIDGVSGPCDCSIFHGDIADLLTLIGGLNVAQLDDIQAAVNETLGWAKGAYAGWLRGSSDTPTSGNPFDPAPGAHFSSGYAALMAKFDALLSAEGVEQAAINALGANAAAATQVTALLSNLAALQTSVTNLANLTAGALPPGQQAELDAIKAATDGLTATAAATAKHLGVGTA